MFLAFIKPTGFVAILLMLQVGIANAQSRDYSGPGFLLLQNGRVLGGTISTHKDKVSIVMDGNSTFSLDPQQVSFMGPTLESLYQNQTSSIRQWGTGEHWHLANWCIQYGLLEHAIEHFQYLEKHASELPRFKQLEHLLREALLADDKVKQAIQVRISDQAPVTSVKSAGGHQDSKDVVLASAQMPVERSNAETNASSSDAWTKHEIPGYIRQAFHKSILPILVSRCGQSGCHGLLGKSEFHVYAPVGEQASSVLAKDLDEVLRYINRQDIPSSPLLAYATKPHGIQKNPSFNPVRAEDRELIDRTTQWIKSLALSQKLETTMPSQFTTSAVATSAVATYAAANPSGDGRGEVTRAVAVSTPMEKFRPSKNRIAKGSEEQDRNAKLSKPAKSTTGVFLTGGEISDLEAAIAELEKKSAGKSGDENAKKDPFDPDVFNRKFR